MNTSSCHLDEDWNPLLEKSSDVQKICSRQHKHRSYQSSLYYGLILNIARKLSEEEYIIIEEVAKKTLAKNKCDLITIKREANPKIFFYAEGTTSLPLIIRSMKCAISKRIAHSKQNDSIELWGGRDRIFTL
jgi:hypothetical protein